MMADNVDQVVEEIVMELDLNQEPSDMDSVLGFRSFLNDLESAQSRIEERIRHLEAVTARVWERHRLRQSAMSSEGGEGAVGLVSSICRGCKRDSSHLVAKALAMESEVKKVEKEDDGSFFDCNICLGMASEPVLTCCGHLYCWACFYQLPYVDSMVKECPVCKGEVADGNVIPVYCNGNNNRVKESESGVKIPPRPKANRVESVRQQHLTRGLSHIPVAEALRRIRASIGMVEQHPNRTETEPVATANPPESQNADRVRPRVYSRVFSESAASLSSELDNAQRIFEDLAASITDRILQRSSTQTSSTVVDSVGGDNTADVASTSRGNEDSDVVAQLGNLIPTTSGERDQPSPHSSSARRIFSLLRFSETNDEVSRETRRRRLN